MMKMMIVLTAVTANSASTLIGIVGDISGDGGWSKMRMCRCNIQGGKSEGKA